MIELRAICFDFGDTLADEATEEKDAAGVTQRAGRTFSVALIAYTRDHVGLARKASGQRVNIEVDIVAKYVESLLAARLQPQAAV